MNLKDIGYNTRYDAFLEQNGFDSSNIGRVAAVHKDRYKVITAVSELNAVLTGNYLYSASSLSELPAVGDWVHLNIFDDGEALITALLPRHNQLERRTVGKETDSQLIAANIDFGFIVDAVGENFKLNRIERYMAICRASNIEPIILITKIDLIDKDKLQELTKKAAERLGNVKIFPISNINGSGIENLLSKIEPQKTYCLLGLSGVGKSTLINNLIGEDLLKTKQISDSTKKGVHTTTHRELFVLNNGSIIIDNPGMREIGLIDATDSVDAAFEQISKLSIQCRFTNCTHTNENGCVVQKAIEQGSLEKAQLDNYLKMKREQFHFSASVAEKRNKDKQFGKMVKSIKKSKPRKRY